MAKRNPSTRHRQTVSRKSKKRKQNISSNRLTFEQLEARLLLATDFGDAPIPYPVTVSEFGAAHDDGSGLRLGSTIDGENDGEHSPFADFDDVNGQTPDDEDGVAFGPIQVGGSDQTIIVTVEVPATSPSGKLDAWIDFNGDGSWGGPGEQIFDSLDVVSGGNVLTYDVPSYAIEGQTFARFRLSSSGSLGVQGFSPDGEVEDYLVNIAGPDTSTGSFLPENVISLSAQGAWNVVSADVDGDGDMDVLSASFEDDKIAWYENDGAQSFTPHTISLSADGATTVLATDLDGDGDMDVVSGSVFDNTIQWYENDGNQIFTPSLIAFASGPRSLFAVDFDVDGDIDLLSASEGGDIDWHENDGNQNFSSQVIGQNSTAESVFAADVDSDGDMDVLSAGFGSNAIVWHENVDFQFFNTRFIHNSSGATSVFAVDFDGDGDLDVLSASYNNGVIEWLENDGNENFIPNLISNTVAGATSVFAADLDGDGDLDAVSSSFSSDEVVWHKNDGNQNFSPVVLNDAADSANSVFVADVDGDGDLDVMSASALDDKIAWYENLGGGGGITGPFDFGDAWLPYPTTLAEDGARHKTTGPMLGSTRLSEDDGDHNDFDSDDDGVRPNYTSVTYPYPQIEVTVSGGNGKLDAWIDFNNDGSWSGADEQIFHSVDVVEGVQHLNFDMPNNAVEGLTVARFRLSTLGGLGVTGAAADGEVEDYLIYIDRPKSTTRGFSDQNIISTNENSPTSIHAANIDGDTHIDLVSASSGDNKVVWHKREFGQTVASVVLNDDATEASSVFAADIDWDGDLDVVSGSIGDENLEWYQQDAGALGGFTTYAIPNTLTGVTNLFVADLDGDSDMDIIVSSVNDNKIMWYENLGNGQNWTEWNVDSSKDAPLEVIAIDVDRDGDLDIVTAVRDENSIVWYENDGNENFSSHTVADNLNLVQSVFAIDVDQDGDLDFVTASYGDDKVAWHENNGNQSFTSHIISTDGNGAKSVVAGDVDGDGDIDVVAGSYLDGRVAWYENNGFEGFTSRTITDQANGTTGVVLADIDRDQDLDVISASAFDDKIAFYAQNQNPRLFSSNIASVPEGTQFVQTIRTVDFDVPNQTVTVSISGSGEDNDKFEIINDDELQFKVAPDFENPTDLGGTAGDNIYYVSLLANDGNGGFGNRTVMVTVTDVVEVAILEREIFYFGSSYDQGSDTAVAIDKTPLLAGQIATFGNYSSSSSGINGVIVTVTGLAQTPTLASLSSFFDFKIGNNDSPDTWASAPLPSELVFEADINASGHDRVILTWASNTIENTWLQVNMLANATTGLATDDTFYFGNAIGETGNDATNAIVNLVDVALARVNQTGFGTSDIDNDYDFNRDGRVNLVDVAIARTNQSGFTPLRLIDLTDTGNRGENGVEKSDRLTQPVGVQTPLLGSRGILLPAFSDIKAKTNDDMMIDRLYRSDNFAKEIESMFLHSGSIALNDQNESEPNRMQLSETFGNDASTLDRIAGMQNEFDKVLQRELAK